MSNLEKKLAKAGFEIMETEGQKETNEDGVDLKDGHKAIIEKKGDMFLVHIQDKGGKVFSTLKIKKDGSVVDISKAPQGKEEYVKEFLQKFGAI